MSETGVLELSSDDSLTLSALNEDLVQRSYDECEDEEEEDEFMCDDALKELFETLKSTAALKCLAEVDISRSSLFLEPLYRFPDLEDPNLYEALWGEAEPKYYDDAGLMKYLEKCEEADLIPMRRVTTSLQTNLLNLKYFALESEIMNTILETLPDNVYITTLSFEENRLSNESLSCLSTVLEKNSSLIVLNMSKCYMGAEGAGQLMHGLWRNKSLLELDLSFNNLQDAGVEAIAFALQFNTSIKKLNLSRNNLGEGAGVALQAVLEDNYYLHELDLSWNFFYTARALQPLMDGLKENISIEHLNLSWNGIGEKDAFYHIFSYLKSDAPHVKYLDMSNNRITGTSVRMLKAGLKLNETLTHLDLSRNPLSSDEVELLAETILELQDTACLQSLDLADKCIRKSFIRTLNKIHKTGVLLKYGGIYSHYKVQGPNVKHMLLKRAKYLAMKPKKKKLRKDFGHFVLKLADDVVAPADFAAMLKKQKIKLDQDLIDFIAKTWFDSTKKVDLKCLKEDYMQLYPDTQLPPPAKSKKKKGNKKKKK